MMMQVDPDRPTPLQVLLYGGSLSFLAELDSLLVSTEFRLHHGGVPATYRRFQAFGTVVGPARELYRNPARLLTAMEWAGVVDPTVMHAAMVHYSVCATALVEGGHPSEDLSALCGELDRVEAAGTIVLTEIGRGNSHLALDTEARYDHRRRTFTLYTPHDGAIKVMSNVGWAGLPRVAVVNAQLVVDGRRCGMHAFAFRFGPVESPTSGVRVATIPGSAPVPLDYALISFDGAEIPFDYWLRDSATISAEGQLVDALSPDERLARSLSGVGNAFAAASTAMVAAGRASVAIAARYAMQRVTMGRLWPGAPMLQYHTHQSVLFSTLAQVYACGFLVAQARQAFVEERVCSVPARGVSSMTWAPWVAVHRQRALAKAAAASTLERAAGMCRRLCGLQGVLEMNRISAYEGMAQSFQAAAGDNLLIRLDAGRSLLQGVDYVPYSDGEPNLSGLRPDDPLTAYRLALLRERVMHDRLSARLRDGKRGAREFDVWNPLLEDVIELADAYTTRRTVEAFDAAINRVDDDGAQTALRVLRWLYGIDIVLASAAWHLDHGSLLPGAVDKLRRARSSALNAVEPEFGLLVDGFALPPTRLRAPIAQDDYISVITHPLGGRIAPTAT